MEGAIFLTCENIGGALRDNVEGVDTRAVVRTGLFVVYQILDKYTTTGKERLHEVITGSSRRSPSRLSKVRSSGAEYKGVQTRSVVY
jgi:hypothetical protein